MASLESYLRGQFQRDKQQIRIIDDIVDEVVSVFGRYFDDQEMTWPYDVSRETSEIGEFSFSTHAMISFALDALTERTVDSVLVSASSKPRKLHMDGDQSAKLSHALDSARVALRQRLNQRPDHPEPFVTSGTYGNDDPLTLTWLAELVDRWQLDACKDRFLAAARDVVRRPSDAVLKFGDKSHYEIEHSFLKLRCLHLATAASRLNPVEPVLETRIDRASLETAVHRQLGYFAVPDSRFDPAELVFATEAVLHLDRNGLNKTTIRRIFTILQESQEETPYWRPVAPFLGSKQGMVLFPVSVEIVNSLLRICAILDEPHQPIHFSLIEPLLRRYTNWIVARVERFAGRDGRPVAGWHSEHVNEPGRIHLWETSQVLLFLAHYAGMLQDKIAADGLTEASLKLRDHRSLSEIPKFWRGEPLSKLGENYEVLTRIETRFIKSRNSQAGGKGDNSLLLYGPPGTGKTTVAEQMIFALKWPLLTITVSDFLADGAAEVEARAKGVFQVLQEQQDIVILFDEIDQFLLDRNSTAYKKQTGIFQFMTPGMLTKFQDLRDAAKCVFIVATNYEERIDSAIKRKGRFDSRMLLSVPDTERRFAYIALFLAKRLDDLGRTKVPVEDLQRCAEDKRKALAANTALFGFGDLQHLVARELKIDEQDTLDNIIGKLADGALRVQPAVNLSAYASRFPEDQDEQRPSEELAVLLYLVGEAGGKVADAEFLDLASADDLDIDEQQKRRVNELIARTRPSPGDGS